MKPYAAEVRSLLCPPAAKQRYGSIPKVILTTRFGTVETLKERRFDSDGVWLHTVLVSYALVVQFG